MNIITKLWRRLRGEDLIEHLRDRAAQADYFREAEAEGHAATRAKLDQANQQRERAAAASLDEIARICEQHQAERALTDAALAEQRREIADAKAARIWRKPARELTAEQVLDALQVPETEHWWQAVHLILDAVTEEALVAAETPPTAEANGEYRTHAAGGLCWLRDLKKELVAKRREAHDRANKNPGGEEERDL